MDGSANARFGDGSAQAAVVAIIAFEHECVFGQRSVANDSSVKYVVADRNPIGEMPVEGSAIIADGIDAGNTARRILSSCFVWSSPQFPLHSIALAVDVLQRNCPGFSVADKFIWSINESLLVISFCFGSL